MSMFDEGNLTTISGTMGSGKTDFSLLLMYIALIQGYHVLSNTTLDMKKCIIEIAKFEQKNYKSDSVPSNLLSGLKILKNPKKITKLLKNYHVVHNDIEFLKEVIKHKKNILLLDETNLFSTSKRATTFDAVLFELVISCIRKFYSSMILIIQRYNNFLPLIRELSFCNINKVVKKQAIIELYPINKVVSVVNIPKSPICFETHSFAGFDFLLDWYKLVSELKNLTDTDTLKFLKKQAKTNFAEFIRYDE